MKNKKTKQVPQLNLNQLLSCQRRQERIVWLQDLAPVIGLEIRIQVRVLQRMERDLTQALSKSLAATLRISMHMAGGTLPALLLSMMS